MLQMNKEIKDYVVKKINKSGIQKSKTAKQIRNREQKRISKKNVLW